MFLLNGSFDYVTMFGIVELSSYIYIYTYTYLGWTKQCKCNGIVEGFAFNGAWFGLVR